MFAQLMITAMLVWLIAEALCRLLLKRSAQAALVDVLGDFGFDDLPAAAPPDSQLARRLLQRRQELMAARARLDLAARTTEVTEQLVEVEQELARVQEHLADIERSRRGHG